MGRKNSRELAFKLVFEHLFNDSAELNDTLQCIDETPEDIDNEFVFGLIEGIKKNIGHLTEQIKENLKGYVLERIYKIDLAILLVAVYEIQYENQTPAIVVNEAVKLAKKYSTDKSPAFINGVLASIING